MALCPVCGDRSVTKPQLGMCNVCFADMRDMDQKKAQHRADFLNAAQAVQRREAVRVEVAHRLRSLAATSPEPNKSLFEVAALICEGRDPLMLPVNIQTDLDTSVPLQPQTQQVSVEIESNEEHEHVSAGGIIILSD